MGARVEAALKQAAKQPEWQDHFSGTAPQTVTRAQLREAMDKAGVVKE